jgi:hypothetical protein
MPISQIFITCLSWKLVSRHGLGYFLLFTICIRQPTIVLLDPCNIAARRPLMHPDEASPNLAALFVFLDSEQRTVVARGEACIKIPKRVRRIVHGGVDIVAAWLVEGAPSAWLAAQELVLDEGWAIESILRSEFSVLAQSPLSFGWWDSHAYRPTQGVIEAPDVVAVESDIVVPW